MSNKKRYEDNDLPKASLSEITPALAEKWLERVPEYQRKIDPRRVKGLVLAILKGDWAENGATIVFNEEGFLVDGQHRLRAIMESGRTVRSLVVRGVSKAERTFQTIGDEKPRRVQDFMRCANANVVGAVCRFLYEAANGSFPEHKKEAIPYVEILKFVKKYEGEIQPLIAPIADGGKLVRQHSFCVFLVFYYSHIEPVNDLERLVDFFARLGDGVSLTKTDPVYQLRSRFMNQASTVRIDRVAARAMIMKALHSYLDHQPMQVVRYEPARESFPELRKSDRKEKAGD